MYNDNLSLLPIRWDAHGCPPFKIGSDLSFLNRYKKAGVNFISLNIGFDLTTQNEAISLIEYFYQWLDKNQDQYSIINSINQLFECRANNRLGIAFDIEGCTLLNGNLQMVSHFYSLGVKQLAFVYNNNNMSGSGCLDIDIGLTAFGKQLIRECNQVGMIIDCSHVGYKTSMEIIELSQHPVIFSHSNPMKLFNHPRNITDDQIIACAEQGGVIGINGIGIFLGNNDVSSEKIVEHIDYIAQLVGTKHVGIGLDCIFDTDEIKTITNNHPNTFPNNYGFNNVATAQPEQFSEFSNLLTLRGYSDSDINNILGENFLRVAKIVWR